MIWCFNPYSVIDDHNYDGNHTNGTIDLTDKGPFINYVMHLGGRGVAIVLQIVTEGEG